MDDIHISRELYQAVEKGELPREFLEALQAEHLRARCPYCRAEADAYAFRKRAEPSAWSRFLQVLSLLIPRWMVPAERDLRGAQGDFEELLALPLEDRARRLTRARSRFRSPGLVQRLLDESRRRLPAQPTEALHFAELAWKVANRNPGMPEFYELYVLATATMANACRAQDQNSRAEELFALARQIMDKHGVTDPAVIARVDDLMGSLRKDQRRFPEAERLLKRAAVLYGLVQSAEDHARVLTKLADTYCARGSLRPAIETLQTALGLLGPESDPALGLCAHYNLAFYLVSAGRLEEAADQLEVDEPLYRLFPKPWAQLRLLWLQGDIAAGKGDLATAERFYLETREGFIVHRMGYDAAMISLDLAILYLQTGRLADVQQLAEEMIAIFQAQDVNREALAALRLFQEAARRQELTVEKGARARCLAAPGCRGPEILAGFALAACQRSPIPPGWVRKTEQALPRALRSRRSGVAARHTCVQAAMRPAEASTPSEAPKPSATSRTALRATGVRALWSVPVRVSPRRPS